MNNELNRQVAIARGIEIYDHEGVDSYTYHGKATDLFKWCCVEPIPDCAGDLNCAMELVEEMNAFLDQDSSGLSYIEMARVVSTKDQWSCNVESSTASRFISLFEYGETLEIAICNAYLAYQQWDKGE